MHLFKPFMVLFSLSWCVEDDNGYIVYSDSGHGAELSEQSDIIERREQQFVEDCRVLHAAYDLRGIPEIEKLIMGYLQNLFNHQNDYEKAVASPDPKAFFTKSLTEMGLDLPDETETVKSLQTYYKQQYFDDQLAKLLHRIEGRSVFRKTITSCGLWVSSTESAIWGLYEVGQIHSLNMANQGVLIIPILFFNQHQSAENYFEQELQKIESKEIQQAFLDEGISYLEERYAENRSGFTQALESAHVRASRTLEAIKVLQNLSRKYGLQQELQDQFKIDSTVIEREFKIKNISDFSNHLGRYPQKLSDHHHDYEAAVESKNSKEFFLTSLTDMGLTPKSDDPTILKIQTYYLQQYVKSQLELLLSRIVNRAAIRKSVTSWLWTSSTETAIWNLYEIAQELGLALVEIRVKIIPVLFFNQSQSAKIYFESEFERFENINERQLLLDVSIDYLIERYKTERSALTQALELTPVKSSRTREAVNALNELAKKYYLQNNSEENIKRLDEIDANFMLGAAIGTYHAISGAYTQIVSLCGWFTRKS